MSDMISCQLKLEYQLNSHIICYALNLDESHTDTHTHCILYIFHNILMEPFIQLLQSSNDVLFISVAVSKYVFLNELQLGSQCHGLTGGIKHFEERCIYKLKFTFLFCAKMLLVCLNIQHVFTYSLGQYVFISVCAFSQYGQLYRDSAYTGLD